MGIPIALLVASNLGCCGLEGLDVCSLLALGTGCNIERYALAFLEGLEATGVDCRVVREEIFAAILRCDKAKALCVVKPFYCSVCHDAPTFGR
jgi:hypothetical protein